VDWHPTIGEPLPCPDQVTGVRHKLQTYTLNPEHVAGGPKARGFRMILGITVHDLDYLVEELEKAIRHAPVTAIRDNAPHGLLCEVQIPVRGVRDQRSRCVPVITAWQLANLTAPPRLVSAYIKD
jgi:hypothetical protein